MESVHNLNYSYLTSTPPLDIAMLCWARLSSQLRETPTLRALNFLSRRGELRRTERRVVRVTSTSQSSCQSRNPCSRLEVICNKHVWIEWRSWHHGQSQCAHVCGSECYCCRGWRVSRVHESFRLASIFPISKRLRQSVTQWWAVCPVLERPVLAKDVRVLDQDVFRCRLHDTTVRFVSILVVIP